MKKNLKFFLLSLAFVGGVFASINTSEAKLPGDELGGGGEHTCYDSYETGSNMYIFNCNKCTPQRAADCADQSKCTT